VAGTNPTWGTNLALIAPVLCESTGTLNAATSECSAVLSGAFQRFSATFVLPANVKNLIPVIWSDALPVSNDEFHISEAGLFDGTEIRDYYPRKPADELLLCQRYYWKTFGLAVAPAQNAGATTGCITGPVGVAGATALAWAVHVPFPVRMRVAPSAAVTGVTLYSPASAAAQSYNITQTVVQSSTVTTDNTDRGVNITATGGTGGTVGQIAGVHMTVDVDI
jgi:hypothetical protein